MLIYKDSLNFRKILKFTYYENYFDFTVGCAFCLHKIQFSDEEIKLSTKEELIRLFNNTLQTEDFSKNAVPSLKFIANKKNPFDQVGINHNELLSEIRLHETNTVNICDVIGELVRVKGLSLNFTCSEVYNVFMSEESKLINNGDYSSVLFDELLTNNKISSIEHQIVNTTLQFAFTMGNLTQKIALIKAAENFVANNQSLDQNSKNRILMSFAILKYSSYYWEVIEQEELICPPCVSYADAVGIWYAMNGDFPVGIIEDGKDVYAFGSFVSSIARLIYY